MKQMIVWAAIITSAVFGSWSCGKKHIPKNVIIMISDGCGYNHINAASIYQYGKMHAAVYERFPVKLAMCTSSASGEKYDPQKAWQNFEYVKKRPTDSAATAMSTGVKTYNGAIGMDMQKRPVPNIVEQCEQAGKSTGVVTSVILSHATPAGFSVHNISRDNYEAIARSMLMSGLDVIMGAGHPLFNVHGQPSVSPKFDYVVSAENG